MFLETATSHSQVPETLEALVKAEFLCFAPHATVSGRHTRLGSDHTQNGSIPVLGGFVLRSGPYQFNRGLEGSGLIGHLESYLETSMSSTCRSCHGGSFGA